MAAALLRNRTIATTAGPTATRGQPTMPRRHGDGRWRLPRQPRGIMPYRLPVNASPLPGWKHDLEHRPPEDSCPRRARTSAYESVKHLAQLPPQTRRRVVRHLRCRSDAQPRHDPLTIPISPDSHTHRSDHPTQLIITGQPLVSAPSDQLPGDTSDSGTSTAGVDSQPVATGGAPQTVRSAAECGCWGAQWAW
jgi:hypothetical protein